ncbi:MAG: hypothetical protein WBM44_15095 [Waterburya sp.]
MSVKLDRQIETTGTKFKVFPQPRFLSAFSQPETITISVPPHMIEAGPADDRFYVVDAINKRPYRYPYLPPYRGPSNPPIQPDPATGHFDHLDVDSREFKCAHMYAIVRRALDIWEDYFGRRIEWHFNSWYQRMELIPLIHWDNAHSGWGFLEFGFGRTEWGGIDLSKPYCMNHDILAHELGHSIIFSQVGVPENTTDEYWGFHESAGDVVALISLLHFDKVVSHLLDRSKGNLFTVNELSRVGELSHSREIRRAFNYKRMSNIVDRSKPHDLSEPLTGALFDIFVEVFQKELVKSGLIDQELADLSYHGPEEPVDDSLIQDKFDLAYVGKESEFKSALFRARDYWGELLAKTWSSLSSLNYLYYANVVSSLLSTDINLTGGEHQEIIRKSFVWREISFPDDSIAFRSFYVSDLHLD